MLSTCRLGDVYVHYTLKCVACCGPKMEDHLRWSRTAEDVILHTVGDVAYQRVHRASKAVLVGPGRTHDH